MISDNQRIDKLLLTSFSKLIVTVQPLISKAELITKKINVKRMMISLRIFKPSKMKT